MSNVFISAFITHSASVPQLKYIFQYLLPDLRGKTIIDVGSRTGAVLYGASIVVWGKENLKQYVHFHTHSYYTYVIIPPANKGGGGI